MNVNIILKIKKLLALSESSNEYESKQAMLKAQELLVKHKLSIRDVEECENAKVNVIENETEVTFTRAKWKGQLAYLVADNFGCYSFFRTSGTNRIVFMGRDEDVTVCTIVLEYAIDSINSVVRRLRYQYSKGGYSTRGVESDYALGFIEGLRIAFEKQKRANQEWGLVLVKDQAVIEEYNNINFKGRVNTNQKYQGFHDVYDKGLEDGEKFSISDKIAEGEEEGVLELEID